MRTIPCPTVAAAILLASCSTTVWRPELQTPGVPPAVAELQAPLKVHLRSGGLVVLARESIRESASALEGSGTLYGPDRARVRQGQFTIPLDSITLLETSTPSAAYPVGMTVMGVWTVLTGTVTAICVSNPKSCFGSCPTFYGAGDSDAPAAEGFSGSIARVLEARDVDALYRAVPKDSTFELTMRNEALETQAVHWVRLLATPRPAGGRVLATADARFYEATGFTPPDRCRAPEGDCADQVRALDRRERISPADSFDLASRETIELEFPPAEGPLGLVLGSRRSLVSTYVFYQTLAYMGRSGADLFAALEDGDSSLVRGVRRGTELLGRIDVAVDEGGGWRAAGSFAEMGPIATDVQVVPLGENRSAGAPIRIRLSLAKGGWRIDWLAVARLGAPVTPAVLEPSAVTRDGAPDTAALAALRAGDRYLATYPGDAYRISFSLPPRPRDYELFLDTRGYYYEWMRSEWLRDENPAALAEALLAPDALLRHLAPAFKRIEPDIERLFWSSRFGR